MTESLRLHPFSATVNGMPVSVEIVQRDGVACDLCVGVVKSGRTVRFRSRGYCGKRAWKNAMAAGLWWAASRKGKA